MNVLITGAASGIGYQTAKQFTENGHTVYCLDINSAVKTENFIPFTADITDENSLIGIKNSLAEKKVSLDCIINVAGIFFMDNFLEVAEKRLEKIFDVNLLGAMRVNKTFFPLLKRNGKIIIVTSEVAPLDPLPFNGIYNVTKTALDAYSQALRHEAGLLGVKVITVRPGAVKTPLADGSIPSMKEMSQKSEYFGGQAEIFEKIMKRFTGTPLPPEKLGKVIYNAALKKRPKIIYTVHANKGLKLLSILPKRTQVAIIKKLLNKKGDKKQQTNTESD